jgi:hypothetical protein
MEEKNKEVYCYDQKMKFLCELFPTVDKETIIKTWENNNYNMNKTTDILQENASPNVSSSSSDESNESTNSLQSQDSNSSRKSVEEERKPLNSIILDCKVKHGNCIEISYFIPEDQMVNNAYIALYDKFESNLNQYINIAHCHGKLTAFVHFDHIKHGNYIVKLVMNEKEVISKDVCVGKDVPFTFELLVSGKKRKIKINVENEKQSYWIGIYEDSVRTKTNNQYLLSSNFTTNKEIILDITQLKQGKYDLRIFTKESTEGFIFKTYHSCGDTKMTLLQ